jgi:hypothetical protein
MEADQEDRDPARAGADSRAAEAGVEAAVTARARAATVFVRAAAKKQPTSWELPVLK